MQCTNGTWVAILDVCSMGWKSFDIKSIYTQYSILSIIRNSIIRTLQQLTLVNRKNAVYFDTLDNSKSFSLQEGERTFYNSNYPTSPLYNSIFFLIRYVITYCNVNIYVIFFDLFGRFHYFSFFTYIYKIYVSP